MSDPVAFRAGAMCIASEPHRSPGEDWPCSRCMTRARAAVAAVPGASGGPASTAALGTGVSDDTKGGTA